MGAESRNGMSGWVYSPCCAEESPHEIETKGDTRLSVELQRERWRGKSLKTKWLWIAVGGATGASCLRESNWDGWKDFAGVRKTP
jgi:hypothetical protein